MGVVFLAEDEILLRPTAVKVLSWSLPSDMGQDPSQWFLSEARMVARINHPLVVQIYTVAQQDEHSFIAMEYVDGTSIERALEQDGAFSATRATQLIVQAATALHAAHSCGVIHRDIKPANLLIGADGNVKLTDFGMALSLTSVSPGADVAAVGTPNYSAPEIWQNGQARVATDVYALGATYFHMLTGHPPYPATSLPELEKLHLEAPIPDPRTADPSIPSACYDILKKCLAKYPGQRFASAQEFAWEARALLRNLLPGQRDSASGVVLPPVVAQPLQSTQDIITKAEGRFASALGFRRVPFTRVDPLKCPYEGEPFASTLEVLESFVKSRRHSVAFLSGAPESGRSTLCQKLIGRARHRRMVMAYDPQHYDTPRPTLRALVGVAGLDTSSLQTPKECIDALQRRLRQVEETTKREALIVVDHAQTLPDPQDLFLLARAACESRRFKLLVVGDKSLAERHHDLGCTEDHVAQVFLRALAPAEGLEYIVAWVTVCAKTPTRRVLITPDAGLIASFMAEGRPGALNRIATRMLQSAARERRRLITSWDAWSAATPTDEEPAPTMPPGWPTAEARAVIRRCRNDAGLDALADPIDESPPETTE